MSLDNQNSEKDNYCFGAVGCNEPELNKVLEQHANAYNSSIGVSGKSRSSNQR